MPRQTEKLAVMFADICGSTALYDRLGDDVARGLIAKCITTMSDQVMLHQGRLIKTIGDEILCTFPSAGNAMNAACAMQNTVESNNPDDEHPMHIRIGFHYGDVICEAGDVYGDTVNVAARVAAITRASQIMTTLAASTALPPDLREKTQQIMRAALKGKQGQLDIFQVTWEEDESMRTRIGTPTYRKPHEGDDELTLRYRDQSLKINEQHKSAILGREEACDIQVKNDFASRQHARIELRFGKFIVADQSTNGTYIRFADGQSIRLAREELVLRGSGTISLGQAYPENPVDVVEFATASA